VSLEFLSPDATAVGDRWTPLARSPMERAAKAAGARHEARDGWSVALDYGDPATERETTRATVGFADMSQLGKLEVQAGRGEMGAILGAATGGHAAELGRVARTPGTWWAPLTAERTLAICEPAHLAELRESLEGAAADVPTAGVVDVSCVFGALCVVGPLARETFARFCAIDLRPGVSPVGSLRPGSVARTPGLIICEAPDRYLTLFGAALGDYIWTVVADAAESLGGGPVGLDALEPLDAPAGAEASDRA
jgi:glycine cleavage system aminomethyltransferase T